MNRIEKRLAEDARKLHADVSPELQARIDAGLRSTSPALPQREGRGSGHTLWLAGSLTGLAASLVFVFVLSPRDDRVSPPPAADLETSPVPVYVGAFRAEFPLNVETADLTAPLEAELEYLRSDIERAREDVERDLRFTF